MRLITSDINEGDLQFELYFDVYTKIQCQCQLQNIQNALRTVRTPKIRPRTPLSEESAVPPYELLKKYDAEVAKREQAS